MNSKELVAFAHEAPKSTDSKANLSKLRKMLTKATPGAQGTSQSVGSTMFSLRLLDGTCLIKTRRVRSK